MSGYAQNAELELDSGADPEAVREKLKRISSEADRMALMVTQILDATRIEEGRMVLEYSPCRKLVIYNYFNIKGAVWQACQNRTKPKKAIAFPFTFSGNAMAFIIGSSALFDSFLDLLRTDKCCVNVVAEVFFSYSLGKACLFHSVHGLRVNV